MDIFIVYYEGKNFHALKIINKISLLFSPSWTISHVIH